MKILTNFVSAALSLGITMSSAANSAELSHAKVHPPPPVRFALTFERIPIHQLIMLYYDQCEKKALVFDPGVSKLDDLLTLKTPSLTCLESKSIVRDALERSGVVIEALSGHDVVKAKVARDERDSWRELIYRPRFRDALELAQLAAIAVRKGAFAHQRQAGVVQLAQQGQAVAETGSNGASITSKPIDKLVFFGPPSEVKAIEGLLNRLDTPQAQIEIAAGIYEFQNARSDGSAVNAAIKLFDSKLSVKVDSGTSYGSSLRLSLPNIDAALSLLDGDTRFKYVARPKVMIKDGEQVTFTSGQDVRVDGQAYVNSTGQVVASKATVTAGVMLQATPYIRDEMIDVLLHQVVSDFVSSPNNDPSVMRRDLTTRLMMEPGYVYVIGGLQTNRKTQGKRSILGWQFSDASETTETEVLLLLTARPTQTGGLRSSRKTMSTDCLEFRSGRPPPLEASFFCNPL